MYFYIYIYGVHSFSAVTHFLYKLRDHTYHSLRANTFDQWRRTSPKLNDSPTEKCPSAVSSVLWRECPGPSRASSLMLAHLLGHEKRRSILKCTRKLNTSHCRTKCCKHREAFDEQKPHEFYTRGSFPEGFEHWPQVFLSVWCIYKG